MVAGRSCLVVGGGKVAARKVEGLLSCGARVTVVAPDVVDAIRQLGTVPGSALSGPSGGSGPSGLSGLSGGSGLSGLSGGPPPGSLTIDRRPYRSPEAADYQLVVTATGRGEVDGAVFADAQAAGVWVNSADDVDNCSFLLPAVHRTGKVTVAVSTGGASPALAGWLRDWMAETLDFDVSVLAELLEEARSELKGTGRSTESLDWTEVLETRVVPLVRQSRIDDARAALADFISG